MTQDEARQHALEAIDRYIDMGLEEGWFTVDLSEADAAKVETEVVEVQMRILRFGELRRQKREQSGSYRRVHAIEAAKKKS